jgi:type IV pilus assembly protein PilO
VIPLSVSLQGPGAGGGSRSIWRSRAALFVGLGILLLVNAVVLVVYHGFYDQRFRALSETKAALTVRQNEARAASNRAAETEKKVVALRDGLESFYSETLGARKDRLAPMIEEVYELTQKAGFMPQTIGFAEDPAPGAERFSLTFQIDGRYADVRRFLYVLETSPKFFVLERVRVSMEENAPDVLRVSLTVSHYFRAEAGRALRTPRRPAARPAPATKADAATPEASRGAEAPKAGLE